MGESPPVAASQTPSRVRFGVLGFACTLSLITYLDRICISRVSGDMRNDLGLSKEQFGWVFNAFTLGYLLMEMPSGRMGDVWARRRVLTRIVLWWSLFTAMTGSVWSFSLGNVGWLALVNGGFLLLLVVRFLFGCGEAGAFPNITRVVAGWFPYTERGAALGMIWMCARIGGALAPLIVSLLADTVGWRLSFWVLGAIGLVWCAFFYRWYRDTPEHNPACNQAERELIYAGPYGHGRAAVSHPSLPWPVFAQRVLGSMNVLAISTVGAGISFSWYFYATWQFDFLKDVHHLDGTPASIAGGLPFLTGGIGALIGGRLSDRITPHLGRRWGRSLIGVVGLTGAGFAFLAAGFVDDVWLAVFLLCLTTFFNDLTVPVGWAVCADIGGRFAGTVSGLMNMLAGIGPLISQPSMPYWWSHYGWSGMFTILAVVWFISAALWLLIDASRLLIPEAEAPDARARMLQSHEATNQSGAAAVEPPRPENEDHIRE